MFNAVLSTAANMVNHAAAPTLLPFIEGSLRRGPSDLETFRAADIVFLHGLGAALIRRGGMGNKEPIQPLICSVEKS